MIRFLLIAFSLLLIATPADARRYHHRHHTPHHRTIDRLPGNAMLQCDNSGRPCGEPQRTSPSGYSRSGQAMVAGGSETILGHPAGCPARAFCACGASVEVFGHSVRELWPAAAWYKFPRTSPAAGMVAVRLHHVFVLRDHVEGSIWMTADYNSGGHQSRLHARSIAGYTIVNPHASRYASR